MRHRWKNQFELIEGNSLFHNKAREIFSTDSFFKNLKCFQEVPVIDLVPGYSYKLHRVDWYIDELHCCIELMGIQHSKVVNYGNIGFDQAQRDFREIQYRDSVKKEALVEAGYEYRIVGYKDYPGLSAEILKRIIYNKGEPDER